MTVNPSSSPNQGRRRSPRWWLIGGLIALALVLIGAAAVYAGTRLTDDPESTAEPGRPTASPTTPGLPGFLGPSEQPEVRFDCTQVFAIIAETVGVDIDYVESRRAAAERFRQLAPTSPVQRAALGALIDEYDAVAQMVEDDPGAEAEATIRERAARDSFIESGACDY